MEIRTSEKVGIVLINLKIKKIIDKIMLKIQILHNSCQIKKKLKSWRIKEAKKKNGIDLKCKIICRNC